jgi:hypothetical protein
MPETADDMRELIEAAIEDWFNHLPDDSEPAIDGIGRQLAAAVLAVRDGELDRLRNRIAALEKEGAELHTWGGLLELLDEHWPEDIFPTEPDSETRDPGPRIVSLLCWVERLRAELAEAGEAEIALNARKTAAILEAMERADQAEADRDAEARSAVSLRRERDALKAAVERVSARHQPKMARQVQPCPDHADRPRVHPDCPDCEFTPIRVCSNRACCGWPCDDRIALDGVESPAAASTAVSAATEAHGGTGEAQEG